MSTPDPEASGRPFPDPEHSLAPRKPRTLGGAVYLVVCAATALGLVLVVVLDRWKGGLSLIGATMVAAALARLVIRDDNAGMLGLRRKFVDVLVTASLGAGLLVLANVIRDRP
jgi:hypothetical protein